MWVAERISLKGIGNGTSMFIFLSIVSRLLVENVPDWKKSVNKRRNGSGTNADNTGTVYNTYSSNSTYTASWKEESLYNM